MFDKLPTPVDDPIESLFQRIHDDPRADKLDLGIGVYRDESGRIPLFAAVSKAEQRMLQRAAHKGYVGPLGNMDYCRLMSALVLGADHVRLRGPGLVMAQTPGAGGALRTAAELIKQLRPGSRVWFSDPVWLHQLDFFRNAGLEICRYRYYRTDTAELQAEAMLQDLAGMRRDDVLVLHGSCHNPTGEDPPLWLWEQLALLLSRTGAIPLVDIAYQGFGDGIEADAEGLRLMAAMVPEMLLVATSSKSFGIYRDRAGLLALLHDNPRQTETLKVLLRDGIRSNYFMPPDHGAQLVATILADADLNRLWREELDGVRNRIHSLRRLLRQEIELALPGFDGRFLERQKGMFSCLPVTPLQQQQLERESGIFMLPQARLNFAALAQKQATRVAQAFAAVRAVPVVQG
jgi:aspartate aminotransferase